MQKWGSKKRSWNKNETAETSFILLHKVWSTHSVTLSTKLNFFNSRVVSVQIYGCESWKGLKEMENRVRRFESE